MAFKKVLILQDIEKYLAVSLYVSPKSFSCSEGPDIHAGSLLSLGINQAWLVPELAQLQTSNSRDSRLMRCAES